MEYPTLTELVKSNSEFNSLRAGFAYYNIYLHIDRDTSQESTSVYRFTIPLNDIGAGTLERSYKTSILLMRWIRKAIETKELIHVTTY